MPQVGIVLVSHSVRLAEGAADLAAPGRRGNRPVLAAGGTDDGGLGTSAEKVAQALRLAEARRGRARAPRPGQRGAHRAGHARGPAGRAVVLADAPFVEGAVAATVTAAAGADLTAVAKAAEEAWHARKL